MRLFRQILVAASMSIFALATQASPSNPVNGVDYRTLPQAQPTTDGKKVEVLEFFWYNCPHCAAFEDGIVNWAKKQGDKIIFKQVPIAFNKNFIPQQKLFYTLEAMGKSDELNPKIFHAIHVERQRVDTDKTIFAFVEKQGIDMKKFTDIYNSFDIQQNKVRLAAKLQDAYQVDGVPLVAIDGRYVTSPSLTAETLVNQPESMLQAATLQVMDFLVNKEIAARSAEPGNKPAAPVKSTKKK